MGIPLQRKERITNYLIQKLNFKYVRRLHNARHSRIESCASKDMEWKGFVFIYSLPKSETREWIGLSGPQPHEKERNQGRKAGTGILLLLSLLPQEPPAGVSFYSMEIIYLRIKKIWCINEKYFGRYYII